MSSLRPSCKRIGRHIFKQSASGTTKIMATGWKTRSTIGAETPMVTAGVRSFASFRTAYPAMRLDFADKDKKGLGVEEGMTTIHNGFDAATDHSCSPESKNNKNSLTTDNLFPRSPSGLTLAQLLGVSERQRRRGQMSGEQTTAQPTGGTGDSTSEVLSAFEQTVTRLHPEQQIPPAADASRDSESPKAGGGTKKKRRAGVACLLRRNPSPHSTKTAASPFEAFLILRQRRQGDPWSGQVAFPGGKCESDESLLEGCLREVREEIGVDLSTSTRVDGRGTTEDTSSSLAHFVCALDAVNIGNVLDVHCLVFEVLDSDSFEKQLVLEPGEVAAAGWFDLCSPERAFPAELRTDLAEHPTFFQDAKKHVGRTTSSKTTNCTTSRVGNRVENKASRTTGSSSCTSSTTATGPPLKISNLLSPSVQRKIAYAMRMQEAVFSALALLPSDVYVRKKEDGADATGMSASNTTLSARFPDSTLLPRIKGPRDAIVISSWSPVLIKQTLGMALRETLKRSTCSSTTGATHLSESEPIATSTSATTSAATSTRANIVNSTSSYEDIACKRHPFLLWGLTKQLIDMVLIRVVQSQDDDKRQRFQQLRKVHTTFFGYRFERRFGSRVHDVLFGLAVRLVFARKDGKHEDRHWLDHWRRYFELNFTLLLALISMAGGYQLTAGVLATLLAGEGVGTTQDTLPLPPATSCRGGRIVGIDSEETKNSRRRTISEEDKKDDANVDIASDGQVKTLSRL
ncbi:unnamed protein product [Amoebophrya sp. A25]|nr:unnamed protein product [Amoebophrya sp. A25]|eukprot:GSA25T00015456001.1